MTIATTNNRMDYVGDGVTLIFPYTYKIFNNADLVVTKLSAGVESTLVINTDYTVSGAGLSAGGNVIMVVAPLVDDAIVIRRVLSVVQETDIKNQTTYYPEVLEDSLDRITMVQQQLDEQLSRASSIPITGGAAEAPAFAASIHSAQTKSSPVDADEMPILDSAAAWVLKKFTIANLKAILGITASVGDNDTSIATTAFVQASRLPNFRNKIINGAMTIDQRNGGVAQTITAAAALAYTVDRWYAYCTGANATGQRVAGAATNQYRYRFTGAASVTAIGFAQRIEAENCYDLNNATATLSVDLANSLLTTVTWTAYYANTADAFGTLASPTRTQIATGTFTVTSTVTNYTAQITIPSAAITGIEIVFTVGAQISGTWHIGNVQLEGGNIATPFERRLNSVEMVLCQRYYQTIGGITNGFGVQGYASGAAQGVSHTISFQTTMRATPLTGVMPTMANINTAGAVINNMSTNCFLLIAAATGAGSVSSLNTTGGSATFTSEIP